MRAAEFDEFYAASFMPLVRQLYAMTGDLAEAQDCVQEAFIRAWDKRRTLTADGSPAAWVRKSAYRLVVSRWRARDKDTRAHVRAVRTPETPDGRLEDLMAALGMLPMDVRRTLVLHHLCDLSVADVARELGVPVGTVKARLSRGREALRRVLDRQIEFEMESDHV